MVESIKVFAGVLLIVIAAVFVLSVTGVFDSFFDSQVKQERAYWDGKVALERQKGENTINEIKWWSWANSNRVDDTIRQMYAFLPILAVILIIAAVVAAIMWRREAHQLALPDPTQRELLDALGYWQNRALSAEEQQAVINVTNVDERTERWM